MWPIATRFAQRSWLETKPLRQVAHLPKPSRSCTACWLGQASANNSRLNNRRSSRQLAPCLLDQSALRCESQGPHNHLKHPEVLASGLVHMGVCFFRVSALGPTTGKPKKQIMRWKPGCILKGQRTCPLAVLAVSCRPSRNVHDEPGRHVFDIQTQLALHISHIFPNLTQRLSQVKANWRVPDQKGGKVHKPAQCIR